jgi:hypothetical protein
MTHLNKLKEPTLLLASVLALALAGCTTQPATTTQVAHATTAQDTHQATPLPTPNAAALNAGAGKNIGSTYEAYLSPHQEPGEEEDTPAITPKEFLSTAPSVPRSQRTSRGHGTLRFSKDLSVAYVDVKIENVNAQDIVMFHIHCGKPDQLGPILVDLALMTDLPKDFADGVLSVVVTNADIVKAANSGHGAVGAFTAGCPIVPGTLDKVKTVAGMELIARHSELYFNLHTKGQTFFGDMRGQIHPTLIQ